MNSRDPVIQKTFELADDALQGVIGYYLYTKEAVQCTDKPTLTNNLPNDSFQITPDWLRYYNKKELVTIMDYSFFLLLEIHCFISMIAQFEACLSEFIKALGNAGNLDADWKSKFDNNYKSRLKWAFDTVKVTKFGNEEIIKALPKYCAAIDHARRLRNLVIHNNGFFNDKYENAINVSGASTVFLKEFATYKADKTKKIRIQFKDVPFLEYCYCHIRCLHFLHNEIQFQFFGVKEGYSYRDNNKPIEWKRVLPVD